MEFNNNKTPLGMMAPRISKLGPLTMPSHVIFDYYEELTELPETYSWYDFFFGEHVYKEQFLFSDSTGVLPYPITSTAGLLLRVTLTGLATISVGALVYGYLRDLGTTLWGVNLGIIDYSTKETNEFGETYVVERVYAKTMSCDLFFEHSELKDIYQFFADVRATPTVWIPSENEMYDATIVYGFYKDFNIESRDYSGCYCSLEVEGVI